MRLFILLLSCFITYSSSASALEGKEYAALVGMANAGDAYSQRAIGMGYWRGAHGPIDCALARDWLIKSANQDYVPAMLDLYAMFDGPPCNDDFTGKEEGISKANGMKWLEKAAQAGDAQSQRVLGDSYLQGYAGNQDDAQAANWYKKAAVNGDYHAQRDLGKLYLKGKGVPQDYFQAYVWLNVAAVQASDFEGVGVLRDEAASHLSPDVLIAAQQLSGKVAKK